MKRLLARLIAPGTDNQVIRTVAGEAVWADDGLEALDNISIDDLTDVDTTTTPPVEGSALVFNTTANQWEPGEPASGGGSGNIVLLEPGGTVPPETPVGAIIFEKAAP